MSLTVVVVLALAVVGGCSPAQALCQRQEECASDPPGDDYVKICTTVYDGNIRALRANKEDECHELADAKLAYDACISQLDCDDFREGDHNGECDDELDDYRDAWEDAEIECGTLD